jgi:hypothetical protein
MKFETPVMDVQKFDIEDVVTTSVDPDLTPETPED